jgi:hypothetical protein
MNVNFNLAGNLKKAVVFAVATAALMGSLHGDGLSLSA